MKKVIILLGLASAMSAFTGCSKDEAAAPEAPEARSFTIHSLIAGGDTRTELDTETLKLNWVAGDKIKVYTGEDAAFTEFTTEAGDGVFTGGVQPVLSSGGSYVAVYPDGKFQNVRDGSQSVSALRVSIPKTQEYVAGKGPVAAIPMVGIWGDEDQSVLFKPVGAALKLPVYATDEGTKLTSVAFQFGSGVGVGEIALRNWSLDEYGDYSAPDAYYTRLDFLYGEVISNVTVTGDISLGTTAQTATDVYVAVTPGDYKAGYTVTLTDSEGATMSKKKAAVETIVALQPGKVQKIAPLQYLQKAPKFTITEDPADNTIITASLDEGQTLNAGTTYKYWLERIEYGRMARVSDMMTIASASYASFKSVKISDMEYTGWVTPQEGDTMYFVIEATEADGTIYKRVYDYTYHVSAANNVKIKEIYWDSSINSAQIFFVSGIEALKAASASDVEFSLMGGEMRFEAVYSMADLAEKGAKWSNDWSGEFYEIPLEAFDLELPIPTGFYTLDVKIFSGFTVLTSDSAEFEVY